MALSRLKHEFKSRWNHQQKLPPFGEVLFLFGIPNAIARFERGDELEDKKDLKRSFLPQEAKPKNNKRVIPKFC